MTSHRARPTMSLAASAAGLILFASGCASAAVPTDGSVEALPPATSAAPSLVPTIEQFDFGNAEWLWALGGNTPEPITLVDGTATISSATLTVGDPAPIYSDADGDGDLDAAVALSRLDGNGFEQQWWIWLDNGDGTATQVPFPIAATSRCGDWVKSVTVAEGGFEVHEFRRSLSDFEVPCSDPGTDERLRVVGVSHDQMDVPWPVQLRPLRSFGGICPMPTEWDAYPHPQNTRIAPSLDAEPIDGGTIAEFMTDEYPIYGQFPGWYLMGFKSGDHLACGWFPLGD